MEYDVCKVTRANTIELPALENPSCLHATFASRVSHPNSQIVDHILSTQISTRPSSGVFPSASLTSPREHP